MKLRQCEVTYSERKYQKENTKMQRKYKERKREERYKEREFGKGVFHEKFADKIYENH